MINWTQGCEHKGRSFLQYVVLTCIYFSSALLTLSDADNTIITDDYLQSLSEEVASPEYLNKAKQEMLDSAEREKSNTFSVTEINNALTSMYHFETLLRKKYPSSHEVYSTLSLSARILIFDKFKHEKKLSAAKRMIIERYETK